MRSWDLGSPVAEAVALARHPADPGRQETGRRRTGDVADVALWVNTAPERVAMPHGAVPEPHAEHQSTNTASRSRSPRTGPRRNPETPPPAGPRGLEVLLGEDRGRGRLARVEADVRLLAHPGAGPGRSAQAAPRWRTRRSSRPSPAPIAPGRRGQRRPHRPPSEVRYSSPAAPSQPCRESLKQTVCALAGAPAAATCARRRRWPAPPRRRRAPVAPATAYPAVGEKKCTERMTGHGSGSAFQCAPPSVVASRRLTPTAQPSCPLTKSTDVRLSCRTAAPSSARRRRWW